MYLAPNTVEADGTCPTCHHSVDAADGIVEKQRSRDVPWHFWVVVGMLVLYLGWRLVQGVVWVAHHL